MRLEVCNAVCGYGTHVVSQNVSMSINTGQIVCLLGPNGVGKTTLFKSILGFQKLLDGTILLDGRDMSGLPQKYVARSIGYVPQAHEPPFPFKVLDVVVMGRTAHLGAFASPSKQDFSIAVSVLEGLKISYLKNKIYTEISGGERQLVLIARALAQQPELLIMDEPTSNLDFGNQVRVLAEIKKLAQRGLGVLMTSHSPDHAFLCATEVVLMKKGGELLLGGVDEIVTEENLRQAYGVDVKITQTQNENGELVKACVPMLD
ncbi:iron complex transport system ATP-binding protein [Sporobacter termitidis DSM 10068]|uniref:Iron complex transport system ATP-binding protein n=1 Tax=Sporobacter termitidis DSM 10068 TaxID=1123282 RepID=A0A1M5XCS2_9FIRM|nr:ABC transporter ATP-binding protein [Sporobacter termitidis]SHH97368.1 iron complex transport system ATP-binding protein [Sporobacter termitidis DSM 10068]